MLGMFIHWGIYSALGLHEQALARYDLDKAEYEKLYLSFDPVEYDPEEWVIKAKECGMKYVCFTAKHHDGFCMWDTKLTDYNVMNTPYGKDVLKMLSEACKKHGILLSIYYSNPDWHHENGYNSCSTHQWKAYRNEDIEAYKEYIRGQVTELLTGYGPVYSFFWDIPPKLTDPSMNELVRRLQPGIFINDRGWDNGDFSTPEREYNKEGFIRFTRMTEACNSLGEQSWGYRANEDFYSLRHITHSIDRIMSLGGSYLLNVGPDHKGRIPDSYLSRLMKVGDWYNRMQGALVCHEADDFDYGIKNNKCNVTKKDGCSYFHFYNGVISECVAIKSYPSVPKSVTLLNRNCELPFKVEPLPEFFDGSCGKAYTFLHIYGIPVDELESEAIVIKIQW